MVKNRLSEPDAVERGWLLDGYPRSAEQAEAIEAENIRPDVFILIKVTNRSSLRLTSAVSSWLARFMHADGILRVQLLKLAR